MNWVGLSIALVAALSVATIAHEMGHFLVARRLGIPVKRLTVGLGPVLWRTHLTGEMELVLRAVPASMAVGVPVRRTDDGHAVRPIEHDLMMAAGGPVASLALAFLVLLAAAVLGDLVSLQTWLAGTAVLSAVLALMNLIPIPGLDGGHLLMLTMARFGWELSPKQEAKVHRTGMHLTAAVCVLLLCVEILQRH